MATHPLFTHELSIARQDHLRREAETARSTGTEENDRRANFRWIRRYLLVEETRCCSPESTSW